MELESHLQSSGQVVANQQIEIADLQSLCRMLSRVSDDRFLERTIINVTRQKVLEPLLATSFTILFFFFLGFGKEFGGAESVITTTARVGGGVRGDARFSSTGKNYPGRRFEGCRDRGTVITTQQR